MKKIILMLLALMLALSFSGYALGAGSEAIIYVTDSENIPASYEEYDENGNLTIPAYATTLEEALYNADSYTTDESSFEDVTIILQKNDTPSATIELDGYNYSSLKSITITGGKIIETPENGGRHFILSYSDVKLILTNVTLRGSKEGGGIAIIDGEHEFNDVTFKSCTATQDDEGNTNGGAVFVTGKGSATFTGCTFDSNKATDGGAVYGSSSKTVKFTGTNTFSNNTASQNGGAIYVTSGQTFDFSDALTFESNEATEGNGGAIYVGGTGNITNKSAIVTFRENHTAYEKGKADKAPSGITSGFGGAVFMAGSETIEFRTVSFISNSSSLGGAVYISDGRINFDESASFNTNKAYDGGAVYTAGGTLTFGSSVTFTENEADDNGGALCVSNATKGITFSSAPVFTQNKGNNDSGEYGDGGAVWWGMSLSNFPSAAEFNTNSTSGKPQKNAGNGGALYVSGTGSDTLDITADLAFNNNEAYNSGGAIYAYNVGKININGITVNTQNNSKGTNSDAPISGGGFVYAPSGTIEITDAIISNQTAYLSGGAVFGQNINVNNSTFTGNATTYSDGSEGGAIYVPNNGNLTVNNSKFTGNKSAGNGGAIETEEATVTLTESVFSANEARDNGGAFYISSQCTITVTNCTFDSNQASRGGAIRAYGSLTVDKSYFEGNYASSEGGAIYFNQTSGVSSFALKSSMLRDNISGGGAGGKGGGALYLELENANIDSCTFDSNSISGGSEGAYGGAIYFDTSKSTSSQNSSIVNSTFTGNKTINSTSGNYGGAVYVKGRVNITSCAFTMNNSAKERGGALYIAGSKVTVSGTILVGNSAPLGSDVFSDADSDIYWSSNGYNRVGVYGLANGNTSWVAHPAPESDRENASWTTETFYGNNKLSDNEIDGTTPPFIGYTLGDTVIRLQTLMLNEVDELPDADRATNAIPTSMRFSFPELDQRGVNRRTMKTEIDIGPVFFNGTVPGEPTEPITTYTIKSVTMSGIPNTLRSIGQTASLIALIRYSNGRTAYGGDGTGYEPVEWSSSYPNIVHVDQKGNITALATTPSNSSVTITVKTKRNTAAGTPATDSRPVRVTGQYSYLNISPEYQRNFSSYVQELSEHDIALGLADVNSSSVKSSSFQREFKSAWDADKATQITDLTSSSPVFNTLTSYSASGYVPSKKAAPNMNFQNRNNGDVFPLTYTWNFSGNEVKNLLGHDLSSKTLNASVATELFQSLRIDFEGTGRTFQVVGGSGVSAKDAYTNQALVLAKADGNKGVSITLTAYLANVQATGVEADGPQLMGSGSRKLLVVPDGTNDGAIAGSMWMIQKGSAPASDTPNSNPGGNSGGNNGNNNNGNSSGGGGGGGGCNTLSLGLLAIVFMLKRR